MAIEQMYGGYDVSPMGEDSRRMVVVVSALREDRKTWIGV